MDEAQDTFSTIPTHYNNNQSIAHAYLCTIAAKALVMTEEEGSTTTKCLEDLHVETIARVEMQKYEAVRTFSTGILSPDGVSVIKRDRRRRLRSIQLYLQSDDEGEYLSWKSKRGWKFKYFLISNSTCTLEECNEVDTGRSRHHPDSNENLIFIRLKNNERQLELILSNRLEHSAYSSRADPMGSSICILTAPLHTFPFTEYFSYKHCYDCALFNRFSLSSLYQFITLVVCWTLTKNTSSSGLRVVDISTLPFPFTLNAQSPTSPFHGLLLQADWRSLICLLFWLSS
eukprot:gene647-1249_t